jgi:hypothetical protein
MKTYNFYATLLDAFQRYLYAERLWEQYFSEKYTLADFEQLSKQELIDKINRKPFDSEAADKGTAFNELVDCLAHDCKCDKIQNISYDINIYEVQFKNNMFLFNEKLVIDIVNNVYDAIPQYFCNADLKVNDNTVNLYGYIDELKEFSIIDIKTTSKYNAFKYRDNWQHRVYTYCIREQGINIETFEYLIVDFSQNKTFSEIYNYKDEYKTDLIDICGKFIMFIEQNRNLITDKKIFNL